ncbi:MAG: hypothetical protein Q7T45_27075 [Bradyrhizobium sp.]|uniref:hypothetical protein n=1 Tax=Bradyrhizobium sp. TaxID=376 RepID=UPI00271FB53A|nr:hypothetical protein [Bradyrhizobium sp.]MDO8401475.1 hypothetical protein [Bradyrhizobium sp.]MDO9062799.1 hypothetical protein [Bradyrhizobium sp.]
MKKTFAAFVAAATIAGALVTAMPAAQAQHRHYHGGGGGGAGLAAGLIGGAIIGGAIAASRPAYAVPAPVYVDDYPACRLVRERFWDGYGWSYRRVEVCN